MKKWISRGLIWGLSGYFLTIILIPVMTSNPITPFKLLGGAILWLVTGLAIGSLFYDKGAVAKSRKKKRR